MERCIKIGTRGSKLALWQANWVKDKLISHHPSITVELEIIKTKGDKILDVPLAKVGGKGLFVKEIEEALLNGRIDLAVHSMKDMPGDLPGGLCISAIPLRENPLDVLLSHNKTTLKELPAGASIGTSSLRRSSQLKSIRPDLNILPLRGNLDTRIRKLEAKEYDAIILAAAGVKRLQYEHHISQYLDPNIMLPAVGQGALCIETRKDDPQITPYVTDLDHEQTRRVVLGERAFLHRLEGGCQIPIAAFGETNVDNFTLTGMVSDIDGKTILRETLKGIPDASEKIGTDLAEKLLALGARDILEKIKADEERNNER
ncbi:MAG: hydroxymethylbilane synthase [Desulfobacterales bacterium]|nr:hydroxymethylbilane synthase [Desulfobacterales bacterium]